MTAALLVADDEPAIRRLVTGALARAGLEADQAATAAETLAGARRPGCEVVLLDLGLPDRDGLELIPLLRQAGRSVIVMTARDATAEKVAALDLGADDYVTKPFDTDELVARVRAALRRRTPPTLDVIDAGAVAIDLGARRATRDGATVALTRKEFAVLVELARHPGRVITHAALLKAVWGEAHVGDIEYLRVAVRALRQKLEHDPARPTLIENDPGVGYRLCAVVG